MSGSVITMNVTHQGPCECPYWIDADSKCNIEDASMVVSLKGQTYRVCKKCYNHTEFFKATCIEKQKEITNNDSPFALAC